MELFAVEVNRDDTVRVVSVPVEKETAQFYYIGTAERCAAFGYNSRVLKENAYTSARAALDAYMQRRQWDKQHALTVAGQATKQIASANELRMQLPAESDEASTGKARA